ncbi:ATP-binding cassette subfamily B protein [Celeribacter persicus]|uniref:ATP-binding cassette subfamily B protein n=2 Tax=Celeribacter persicus TaxID=1651082 RepID=A0A2T5HSM2_9RHOB|nr:ATP-binding cassette subfamily B protein [Celeribacter persicus]
MLAAVAAKLLEPWPLKFVIDHVVQVGGEASLPSLLATLPVTTVLAIAAGGLLLVVALRAIFEYASTIAFALVGNRVLTAVRADLFRHLQTLPLAFHTKAKTGDLTIRLISDVGMLKETAVTAALPLAVNGLVLAGMIAVMVVLNWQLALLALLPLPLLWLASLRIGRRIQGVSRKVRKTEGDMAATAAEAMAGIRTVQALGLEERVSSGFGGANAKSLAQGVKAKRLAAKLERLVDVLVGVALAAVLYVGTLFVLDGRITAGDLLVFLTYLKNTFRPVRDYAKYSARLAKATAAGERVIELLDTPATLSDRPGAVAARIDAGRIDLDTVGFSYDGQAVLRDVTLSIPAGQSVAITGVSGVGKSTLTSLLMRLYDPDTGRILIDGQDLRDVSLASLRSRISFVPQETLLFRASVRENLAIAAGREVTGEEIRAAAQLAHADGFIEALPEGYDTVLAERGGTLSAGQRQRIAIARAALRQAPILILDEPTVGLDGRNEAAVSDAIWRLAKGRTTVFVTHDLSLAARADRILCLEGGGIGQDGTHAELIREPGLYRTLWQQQNGGRDAIVAAE